MANRDAFIIVVNTLKALSQTITDEQRKALLQQAVQQHGLSIDEADQILKASGLVVGESINYFEVLGFSIEELQNQSEDAMNRFLITWTRLLNRAIRQQNAITVQMVGLYTISLMYGDLQHLLMVPGESGPWGLHGCVGTCGNTISSEAMRNFLSNKPIH